MKLEILYGKKVISVNHYDSNNVITMKSEIKYTGHRDVWGIYLNIVKLIKESVL